MSYFYFLFLISYFVFLISYFLISYFLFLISYFLFLISFFLFLISYFLFLSLISYFLFLTSYSNSNSKFEFQFMFLYGQFVVVTAEIVILSLAVWPSLLCAVFACAVYSVHERCTSVAHLLSACLLSFTCTIHTSVFSSPLYTDSCTCNRPMILRQARMKGRQWTEWSGMTTQHCFWMAWDSRRLCVHNIMICVVCSRVQRQTGMTTENCTRIPDTWTGFLEEYPSSGFTAGSNDVKVASESALENHTTLKLHIRQKWRRGTAICGEKSCAIADGFEWRINCFPEPNDSHLRRAYWTSAVIFFGKLRTARPVIVASAKFWNFNPSGRSLIKFVANVQICRIQEVTDQRPLPIQRRSNWNQFRLGYRVSKNWLESLVHAKLVQTQEAVRDHQNYEKSTWVSCHARGSIGSGTFSEGIVPSSTTKSFLILVLK